MNSSSIAKFRKEVWRYYKKSNRNDLSWRRTKNPYRIMVSEIMLQQTQVPRVIEKYKEFLKMFPTVRTLAEARLSDVLKAWSGLGYNRRGKYLHDAAKVIVREHKGKIPKDRATLRKLSGMGPYTASAVRVFAYNLPDILIETNIRAAYIHHFASEGSALRSLGEGGLVRDTQIVPIAAVAAKGQNPREWHWALMDYGVHIKKLHKNPARRSKHYVRQSKFDGSLRQVRGAILRQLHAGRQPTRCHLVGSGRRVPEALAGLARDGLIVKEKGKWRIA